MPAVLNNLKYHFPHYIPTGLLTKPDPIPQTTKEDAEAQGVLTAFILRWCVANRILVQSTDNNFVLKIDKSLQDFAYVLGTTNFSLMLNKERREQFFTIIADNNVFFRTTELINMNINVGIMFETSFLDLMVNRIYMAYNNFDIAGETDMTWVDFHRRYPFMWLVMFIQCTIKSYMDPLPDPMTEGE